jgi:hypothetical protein
MGVILGFVLSSTAAGTVCFLAQIERNTRNLLEREHFEDPTQHRIALRFYAIQTVKMKDIVIPMGFATSSCISNR